LPANAASSPLKKKGKKKTRNSTTNSTARNQSRRSSDSDIRSDNKRSSITELDPSDDLAEYEQELREILNNDSSDSSSLRTEILDDDDLAELEREAENEPEPPWGGDTNWANELLEIDPSNPKERQEIQNGIQDLIQTLEINQKIADAAQAELKDLGNKIRILTPDAIEDIIAPLEKAGEIENALSNSFRLQEEISESELEDKFEVDDDLKRQNSLEDLRNLELELEENETFVSPAEQIGQFLAQINDETIDRIIEIEENLDVLQEKNKTIGEQIRQLQEKLGVLREDEVKSKVSFRTRNKLKKGATTGMSVAPYLVPAAKQPVKIAGTALATISLAKSIRHIKNMRTMLDRVSDPKVRSLIQYSIMQKT